MRGNFGQLWSYCDTQLLWSNVFDMNQDPYFKLCVTGPLDGSPRGPKWSKIAKIDNFGHLEAPRDPNGSSCTQFEVTILIYIKQILPQ